MNAPLPYASAQPLQPSSGTGYALPTWPFVPPPELGRTDRARHRIVILGAGLAGLTLAADLGRRGIACTLIDEDDTVGVKGASSRGICYAQKTLEIFERIGTWPRIRDRGVAWSVGRTLAGDEVVYEFDMAAQGTHNASCQPPFVNIQQFYIEWFLVDRILEMPEVDLRWKNRVVGISSREDGVTLAMDTPAGRYEIDADWVVDCTGIRSPVREALGIRIDQAMGTDRWCISDVRFRDRRPVERWTWVEAPFNDGRAVWQHLMADDVWRLDYQMLPDADPEYVSSPEVVADRLRRHLGEDVDFELVWVGPYAYRTHIAETFRQGRVLLAGDCAHVMSPFGARGGNSAIQDADNLGWKLAAVVRGEAGPELLDSYAEERREAAEVNVRITSRTARFLSPPTPIERAMRAAVISLAREHAFARPLVNTGRLSTPTAYTRSALNVGRGGGRSVQNVAITLAGGAPIDLVSVTGEGAGRWLLVAADHSAARAVDAQPDGVALPRCARLICGVDAPAGWSAIVAGAPALAAELGLAAGEVALVRPDLHLAGVLVPGALPQAFGQLARVGLRLSVH